MKTSEREGGDYKHNTSVFIDNLHKQITKNELYDIFRQAGRITDVYISRKERRNINLFFAFVRFQHTKEAEEAVRIGDGKCYRGIKLFAQIARFAKQSVREVVKGRSEGANVDNRKTGKSTRWQLSEWRHFEPEIGRGTRWDHGTNRSFKDVLLKGNISETNRNLQRKLVNLVYDKEKIDWLNQSVIICSNGPYESREISRKICELTEENNYQITALGWYKFILFLGSVKEKVRWLERFGGILKQNFKEIREWGVMERCEMRRIWIEIYGIPVHLWSEENIRTIAKQWGNVIEMNEDTKRMTNMSKAVVMVDTSIRPITGKYIITTAQHEFDIFVQEIHEANIFVGECLKCCPGSGKEWEVECQRSENEKFDASEFVPETVDNQGTPQPSFVGETSFFRGVEKEKGCLQTVPDKVGAFVKENQNCLVGDINWEEAEKKANEEFTRKCQSDQSQESKQEDSQDMGEVRNNSQQGPHCVLLPSPSGESFSPSSSDPSIPPGFEDAIPGELVLRSRERRRRREKRLKKKMRKVITAIREKKDNGFLLENSFEIRPDDVMAFASRLGLVIQGREGEIREKIIEIMEEDKVAWEISRKERLGKEASNNQ